MAGNLLFLLEPQDWIMTGQYRCKPGRRLFKQLLLFCTNKTICASFVFGFMFLVAPGIYLVVIWMLAGPIVVTEQIAGRSALGRSRALIRDNWWRGAGILLVTSILFGVVSAGLQLVFQFIPFVGPVLLGAVNALAYALSSCVLVIFYFDLRCRHEDFDLQVLREQISVDSGSSSTVAQ